MRKLRHTAYAYYFKKITIVGARLPRPTGWETQPLRSSSRETEFSRKNSVSVCWCLHKK